MIYSDLYTKKATKIPNFLALIVIIFVAVFFSKFSLDNLKKRSSASATSIRRVEIANLNSSSVTVYWFSQSHEQGWIIYGESPDKLNQTAGDDRDLAENNKNRYLNHLVTIKELKSNSSYFFRIVSGHGLSSKPNGDAFSFKTLPESRDVSNLRPAFGKIIKESGLSGNNAVVLMHIQSAYPLATLTKSKGDWLMPMNNIRDTKTNALKVLSSSDTVNLEFLTEDDKISTVVAPLSSLNPIPISIIEGRNYDFTQSQEGVLSVSSKSVNNALSEIDILYPKENSIIPASNPLIKGTAIPNSEVKITVNGDNIFYSDKFNADIDGLWRFVLKNDLAPGNYSVTLSTIDRKGKNYSKVRKFTIAKSGESVLGESTPEATLTPTLTPVTSPSATLSGTPTLTPTTVPSTLSPTSRPPRTGGGINPIIITSLSMVAIGLGLLFIF